MFNANLARQREKQKATQLAAKRRAHKDARKLQQKNIQYRTARFNREFQNHLRLEDQRLRDERRQAAQAMKPMPVRRMQRQYPRTRAHVLTTACCSCCTRNGQATGCPE